MSLQQSKVTDFFIAAKNGKLPVKDLKQDIKPNQALLSTSSKKSSKTSTRSARSTSLKRKCSSSDIRSLFESETKKLKETNKKKNDIVAKIKQMAKSINEEEEK